VGIARFLLLAAAFCVPHIAAAGDFFHTNAATAAALSLSKGAPKGVVVLAHGLNVKPAAMGAPGETGTLAALFLDAGYDVYRVVLAGHEGEEAGLERMKNVTPETWLAEARVQYDEARAAAQQTGCPLYLAGFSLGALVYEALMNKDVSVSFDKAVLISPAVAVRAAAHMVLALTPFDRDGIINSRSPLPYRAGPGASINAYKAIFALEDGLLDNGFARCNIPTLVFFNPDDEMLNERRLKNRVSEYKLDQWTIIEQSNKDAVVRPQYNHLMIDRITAGSAWPVMSAEILTFLAK
jgi:hypothetical protein